MKPTIEQKNTINEILINLNKLESKIRLNEYEPGEPTSFYIKINKLFDSLEVNSIQNVDFIQSFSYSLHRSEMEPERSWLNVSDWDWYENYLILLELTKKIIEIDYDFDLPLSPKMLIEREEEDKKKIEQAIYSKFYNQLRTLNSDELKEILYSHDLWVLEKENGVKADLSYVHLFLTEDFRCKNLTNVDFSNSLIQNCLFIGTNLTGANFENSIIENSNFNYAILKDANFENAKITGTFAEAELSGTNIELAQEFTPIVQNPMVFSQLTKSEELENILNYAKTKLLEEFSQIDLYDKEKLFLFRSKAIRLGFIALGKDADLLIQTCFQVEEYENLDNTDFGFLDVDENYDSGKINGYDIEDAFGGEADAYWNID
jgi:hypothetical protein